MSELESKKQKIKKEKIKAKKDLLEKDKKARSTKKEKDVQNAEEAFDNNLNLKIDEDYMINLFNETERNFNLRESNITEEPENKLHTGLLTLDLFIGGGIVPGCWLTYLGDEQSGKSTLCTQTTLASIIEEVPIRVFYDYEGSTELRYLLNIAKVLGLKDIINENTPQGEIFGIRDKKGNIINKPLIRYYRESVLEKFFKPMTSYLKKSPFIENKDGQWYYSLPKLELLKEQKNRHSKKSLEELFKKTSGEIMVPRKRKGKTQGILIVDSFPTMTPQRYMNREDENKDESMAAKALAFSEVVPKLKPLMRPTRFSLIGVNQIRERPGAMGNPVYESGGKTLKFYSDIRLEAKKGVNPLDNKYIEVEPSVLKEGAKDEYEYRTIRTVKNKYSAGGSKEILRIWVKNHDRQNMGFDPVFDIYQFLLRTGQLTANKTRRSKIIINSPVLPEFQGAKPMDWLDFKKLIIGKRESYFEVLEKLGINTQKRIPIKARLLKQIKSGESIELYNTQGRYD